MKARVTIRELDTNRVEVSIPPGHYLYANQQGSLSPDTEVYRAHPDGYVQTLVQHREWKSVGPHLDRHSIRILDGYPDTLLQTIRKAHRKRMSAFHRHQEQDLQSIQL